MAEPPLPQAGAPVRLQITSDEQPEGTLMTLSGELDIASAPLLEQAIESIDGSDPRPWTIDLASLSFIDSTGLRALLHARQAAATAERKLLLRPGPRQVQRVFELSGTLDRFTFAE